MQCLGEMATIQFNEWWQKFKRTGDICPVRLGMTRDELSAVLGQPDGIGGITRKQKTPLAWKYMDLEFYFGPKNTDGLYCIYRDDKDGIPNIIIRSAAL